MRIAILTTDNREKYRHYGLKDPYFRTAHTALLDGFLILNQERAARDWSVEFRG
jgi:hypothetical protein